MPRQTPSPPLTKFTEHFRVPRKVDLTRGTPRPYPLHILAGKHRFHSALPSTPSWGYNGTYGGPTLEVRRGRPIRVRAVNRLGRHPLGAMIDTTLHGAEETDKVSPRTVVHQHGGHHEARFDGYPTATFRPGQSFTYRYTNDQESASLWYHDHALGLTRLNVLAGLFGSYWVRDRYDTGRPRNPLQLPTGHYELPLVLKDYAIAADGKMTYRAGPWANAKRRGGPDQWAPEYFGDLATVNGKVWPKLHVRRGVYRFRVLNASNSRYYRLALDGRANMHQIGTDGGLLNAPVLLRTLQIAPGERADLLIDFRHAAPGTKITMTNHAAAPFPFGTMLSPKLPEIMQFIIQKEKGPGHIPSQLRGGPRQPPAIPEPRPDTTRPTHTVFLEEVTASIPHGPMGPGSDALITLLNGLRWHHAEHHPQMQERPKVNSETQWNIINLTAMSHPVHLHLTQFRVLNRQQTSIGGPIGPTHPPAPHERGWKDTVDAPPGLITRIIVPFGGTRAGLTAPFTGDRRSGHQRFTGTFAWHCHMLEHEDNEMMLPFTVTQA